MGGVERRSGRYRADRRDDPRAVPERRGPPSVADDGQGPRPVPGAAGPDLLARLRGTGESRRRVQRARPHAPGECADRDRARPPRRRLGREPEPRNRGDG